MEVSKLNERIYAAIAGLIFMSPLIAFIPNVLGQAMVIDYLDIGRGIDSEFYLSFDEGSGQYVYDYSEVSYPTSGSYEDRLTLGSSSGSSSSDPKWNGNTQFGYCLDFHEYDYLQGSEDIELDNEVFSFDVWIYPRDTSDRHAIITYQDSSDDEFYGIYINNGHIYTKWGDGGTEYNEYTGLTLSLFEWQHIGYQYCPNKESVFVDGMEIGSKTWSSNLPKFDDYFNFFIGVEKEDDIVRYPFDGMMDEMKICGHFSRDFHGTSGFWNFQEGGMIPSSTVYDRSGFDNDGTCINMENGDFGSGVYGKAIYLDGQDEYVDCGSASECRVEQRIAPPPPHQTVREVLPHTAFR